MLSGTLRNGSYGVRLPKSMTPQSRDLPLARASRAARLVVRLFAGGRQAGFEFQLGHPEGDHVAVAEEAAGSPLAVHEDAVFRAEVDDLELGVVDRDARVLAGDGAVEDADVVFGGAAEADDFADQRILLALVHTLVDEEARLGALQTEEADIPLGHLRALADEAEALRRWLGARQHVDGDADDDE